MATLSYGLNITKKPGASKPTPAKRKPIFGEDESDEDTGGAHNEARAEEIGVVGDGAPSTSPSYSKKPSSVPTRPPTKPAKQFPPNATNLASSHSSSKHTAEATNLDPSIYDYDGSYDALHAPRQAGTVNPETAAEEAACKPKYMSNLLAAAEVRKRDQLRAKEKLLAREREEEGDEFADKEKFVTSAYKRQQAEMRQLEEEERLREEAAQKRAGSGMGAFYRGVLDRTERKHDEAVTAAKEVETTGAKDTDEGRADIDQPKEDAEAAKARELRAKGHEVVVNDEGQVVDKRQLLAAGLNAASRSKDREKDKQRRPSPSSTRAPYQSREGAQRAQRSRHTGTLEDQLLQATMQGMEDDEEEEDEMHRSTKRRKT